jgi:hypothetical protein
MARTPIAIASLKGSTGDTQTVPTLTAGDSANGHNWVFQDGDILVVENQHASTTSGSVTVKAVADSGGRTVDSVKATIAAGLVQIFGNLKADGWTQSDGTINVDLATAAGTLKLYVLRPVR